MSSPTTNPGWLNEQFIEKVLSEAEGNRPKVKKIQVRAATAAGDNYTSDMYRVTVEYDVDDGSDVRSDTESLIVKASLEDESKLNFSKEFETETEVLMKVVPAIHRLLNANTSGKPVRVGARCYGFTGRPHQKLVMEDLGQSGFKMASRHPGLDLKHSKLVVSQQGVLHAASIVLLAQQPDVFETFQRPSEIKDTTTLKNFFTRSFNAIAETVQTWPDGQRFHDKLRRLSKTAFERFTKMMQRDDQGVNVFLHGDAWTNNMLFRYNSDGEAVEVIFLDFQLSHIGSPALDFLYFMYTSPTPEVRSHHVEELIECYHSSLSHTLHKLGFGDRCPSLDAIHREIKNKSSRRVFAFFCARPITSANSVVDLGKLSEEPTRKTSSTHFTEDYIRELQTIVPIFEKEGLLE